MRNLKAIPIDLNNFLFSFDMTFILFSSNVKTMKISKHLKWPKMVVRKHVEGKNIEQEKYRKEKLLREKYRHEKCSISVRVL